MSTDTKILCFTIGPLCVRLMRLAVLWWLRAPSRVAFHSSYTSRCWRCLCVVPLIAFSRAGSMRTALSRTFRGDVIACQNTSYKTSQFELLIWVVDLNQKHHLDERTGTWGDMMMYASHPSLMPSFFLFWHHPTHQQQHDDETGSCKLFRFSSRIAAVQRVAGSLSFHPTYDRRQGRILI